MWDFGKGLDSATYTGHRYREYVETVRLDCGGRGKNRWTYLETMNGKRVKTDAGNEQGSATRLVTCIDRKLWIGLEFVFPHLHRRLH